MSVKNRNVCEKDSIRNPATCNCENGKHLVSIMDDSAITCDEIIDTDAEAKSYDNATSNEEETKATSTNFNEKSITCKTQNLYFTCLFVNYHYVIDSC